MQALTTIQYEDDDNGNDVEHVDVDVDVDTRTGAVEEEEEGRTSYIQEYHYSSSGIEMIGGRNTG